MQRKLIRLSAHLYLIELSESLHYNLHNTSLAETNLLNIYMYLSTELYWILPRNESTDELLKQNSYPLTVGFAKTSDR